MATGDGSSDSDARVREWLDPDATVSDDRAITAPHDLSAIAKAAEPPPDPEVLAAREEGCRTCYDEGHEDAVSAFKLVFRKHGIMSDDEIAHTVLDARLLFTRL